jgi:ApaG protein
MSSSALTRGILVTVRTQYIPEKSSASAHQYAFAYTVTIANRGTVTTQLVSRHWIITDADGDVQEVRGEGVVGAQPVLRPGEEFEYTSWCMIATPAGSMRGSYQMVTADGDRFDAEVAPFRLTQANLLN